MVPYIIGFSVAYKVVQALIDEEFPGTEYPEAFRQEKIDRHWFWHGGFCFGCWRSNLRKADLTVDHVVPIRRGGRNSRENAEILCLHCNSSKGAKMSLWDEFRGRGGRRPRIRD